jgi:hypothetical protein
MIDTLLNQIERDCMRNESAGLTDPTKAELKKAAECVETKVDLSRWQGFVGPVPQPTFLTGVTSTMTPGAVTCAATTRVAMGSTPIT